MATHATSNPATSVTVRLVMRAEADGGRHCPFTEDYAPHFVAAGGSDWLAVRAVQCPGPIAPGDTAEAVFSLLYPTAVDYSALHPDCEFAVHEGPRVIATGTVLSVHHSPNSNATGNA